MAPSSGLLGPSFKKVGAVVQLSIKLKFFASSFFFLKDSTPAQLSS